MIINIRIDHKTADISEIEDLTKDLYELFTNLNDKYSFKEYIRINTCNRNEFFIHTHNDNVYKDLINYGNHPFNIEINDDAMKHVLRMGSGLESMIIGEDQILGQLKDSLNKSKKDGTCGEVLEMLFTKAIHVGRSVRKKTNINKGSVSIGSAAVDLAESEIDNLNGKKVLVIGAGKMSTVVAKALCEKELETIIVANRTHEKAEQMACELGGRAIYFEELNDLIGDMDLVISATGAPHKILDKERVLENVPENHRNKMIMIDLANPRDIAEDVGDTGVKLFNIDDLRGIAEKNKESRAEEAEEAEEIVEEEFKLLKKSYKHREVNELISEIRKQMEGTRQNEQEKAMNKLKNVSNKEKKVIDKLTKSIVDKISYDLILNLKKASEENHYQMIDACQYLFKANYKD